MDAKYLVRNKTQYCSGDRVLVEIGGELFVGKVLAVSKPFYRLTVQENTPPEIRWSNGMATMEQPEMCLRWFHVNKIVHKLEERCSSQLSEAETSKT